MSSQTKAKKARMLVVDDEPDNLDLLYRTFRRDFNVLRAESGKEALELLEAHGEVAVIISDQRMPEMKGTEFLSKTVPQFPDTVRIILTGFTDVEDLVDAINAGQVYRYITKPWDPEELKHVVQRAAETYELLKQRTEELQRAEAQAELITAIANVVQLATSQESALQPMAEALGKSFSADGCILNLVDGGSLSPSLGVYAGSAETAAWLSQDPLTQAAIADKATQLNGNVATSSGFAATELYAGAGVAAHVVTPALYRDAVVAVLSLQWKAPRELATKEVNLIELSAQQVGLAIACLSHL